MPKAIPHPGISDRLKIGLLLIALGIMFAAYATIPSGSRAQSAEGSSAPSVSPPSTTIDREGYTLKPVGVATDKYPAVRVDFSIERGDKTLFRELNVKDVETVLNGDSLTLGKDSLKLNNAPMRFLFMVDRSGSMIDSREGINKLEAAQEALKYFISKLGTGDVAAVGSFDSEPVMNVSPTSNKSTLYAGIGAIAPRKDAYTNLYDAVDFALNEASRNNITRVIFLSDGWEDTADTRKMKFNESKLADFKRRREESIARSSRQKGIYLYTIAIGEIGDPDALGYSYVDFESMCNISNATGGGTCTHVDLPKLKANAGDDPAKFNKLIAEDMKQTLEEIRKLSSYTYSLMVDFPRDLKHEAGELTLTFTVDGRIKLPVVFPYTWDSKTNTPVFGVGKTLAPIFIVMSTNAVAGFDLLQIFLLLLVPVGLLASIPTVYNRVLIMREVQKMNKAIIQVGQKSQLIGQQCPNEAGEWGKRFAFKPGDPVIICPECHTPHHLSCWDFNQHQCMNRICEHTVKVPSGVMAKYGVEESKGSLV